MRVQVPPHSKHESYLDNMKKKRQRKSTSVNTSYYSLKADEKLAIDMRIQNFATKEIAEMCKVEEQTVRTWFMKGGRLYSAYLSRSSEVNEERKRRFEDIDEQIRDAAADAVLALRAKIKRGNISAAEIILEYSGKQPPKKLDVKTPPQVNVNFGDVLDELTQSKSNNNKQADT